VLLARDDLAPVAVEEPPEPSRGLLDPDRDRDRRETAVEEPQEPSRGLLLPGDMLELGDIITPVWG
jgi:hypothetical protein